MTEADLARKAESKEVIIECDNGRKRYIVLSESSQSGKAVEMQGLSERQRKGLGLPPQVLDCQLVDPEAPSYDIIGGRWID